MNWRTNVCTIAMNQYNNVILYALEIGEADPSFALYALKRDSNLLCSMTIWRIADMSIAVPTSVQSRAASVLIRKYLKLIKFLTKNNRCRYALNTF